MTKRHFIVIAGIINDIIRNDSIKTKEQAIEELIKRLSVFFKSENEKFSSTVFRKACFYQDEEE